ncbi:MAG: sulfate reduction electron transfer complex DsrMKJOP subunit DsrO [Planctomycetota bacterium]
MDKRRRNLLRTIGCAVGGLGCGLPILSAIASGEKKSSATKQLAMVIDIRKCLNEELRRACATACHREHNVPEIPDPEEEVKWIWSENYENAFPDHAHERLTDALKGKPVLVLCNHCTHPACVKVCPTQATWKRESDGIVMMDMHRCIGCRYCMAACPYGARSFNWRNPRPFTRGAIRPDYPTRTKGVVEKCDFCVERLRDGRQPACVEASREISGDEGALTFGNLADPNSDVSRILRERHAICRRVHLGTGPNVYYIV